MSRQDQKRNLKMIAAIRIGTLFFLEHQFDGGSFLCAALIREGFERFYSTTPSLTHPKE